MTNTITQNNNIIPAASLFAENAANATEAKKPIASGTIELRKKTKKGEKKGGIKSGLLEVTPEMIAALAKNLEENPPYNGATGRKYTGANVYRLLETSERRGFTDARWYSWYGLQKVGARVKKGEHGTKILGWFYKTEEATELEEETKQAYKRKMKICVVFNAEQCDGIPQNATAAKVEEKTEAAPKKTIKRSFEIKPKTKKAAKIATKEAKATDEISYIRAIIAACKAVKVASVKWHGEIMTDEFLNEMTEAAQEAVGADYHISRPSGYKIFITRVGCYTPAYPIFEPSGINAFTTAARGGVRRIDAAGVINNVANFEEMYTQRLKVAETKAAPKWQPVETPEGATEETKKHFEISNIILEGTSILRETAPAYDGKVYDAKLGNALKDAVANIAGGKYTMRFYKTSGGGFEIYFSDTDHTTQYVFLCYNADHFTMKEAGRKPRFNADMFIKILDGTEKNIRRDLEGYAAAISNESRLNELLATIKAAQAEAMKYNRIALESQGFSISDIERLRG